MQRFKLGSMAVVLGLTLLSVELYGLKFIHVLMIQSGYKFRESALEYLLEPNIFLAILISIVIISLGIVSIANTKKSK